MNAYQSAVKDSILIAGICRNVSENIIDEIERLEEAFADFENRRYLIIESDSKDETLAKLEMLSTRFPYFKYISLGILTEKIENRVERISYCRNIYLSELESNPEYKDVEWLVVSDLDGVNTLLSNSAIRTCWTRTDWQACMANQAAPYYDIYALRHPIWSPDDCWEHERILRENGANPITARGKAIYSRQIIVPQHSPWIEVDSAFGGMGIYKKTAIGGSRYSAFLMDGTLVCEHVPFHAALKSKGAKLFINPDLINFAWSVHNTSHRLDEKLKRKVRSILWVLTPFLRKKLHT